MQELQEQQSQDFNEEEQDAINRAVDFLYTLIEIQMEQDDKPETSD